MTREEAIAELRGMFADVEERWALGGQERQQHWEKCEDMIEALTGTPKETGEKQ